MAITTNGNRQELIVAHVDVGFADVAAGTPEIAMNLPEGTVIVGLDLVTDSAFDASTTLTLTRVNVSDNSVLETPLSAVDVAAAGVDSMTFTGTIGTEPTFLQWDTNQAVTQGAARLIVTYYVRGRAAFCYGE